MTLEKHGMSYTAEYRAWDNMIARCERPSHRWFHLYGGRGVKVAPVWRRSFKQFFADIGARPSPKHSLDRIDPKGNYEPGNVRWATPLQQNLNQKLRNDNGSGYRGVRWNTAMNKWTAEICVDGKNIYLGGYRDKEDAAYVRDQFALQLWGQDASLNVLEVPNGA